MSNYEQIFFDPGEQETSEAARRIAAALQMELSTRFDGVPVVSGSAAGAGLTADAGGTIESNIYAETDPQSPDEESIFDDMPLVFEFRVPKPQFSVQRDVARVLYARFVEGLRWRSALTGEYSLLFAAYDVEHGLRTFPPGTSSEGTHAHLWR